MTYQTTDQKNQRFWNLRVKMRARETYITFRIEGKHAANDHPYCGMTSSNKEG